MAITPPRQKTRSPARRWQGSRKDTENPLFAYKTRSPSGQAGWGLTLTTHRGSPAMSPFPLQAILFWIAVTLAPQDTSQFLVKGPNATWAWTRQSLGWSFSTDRSVWVVQGSTVMSANAKEGGHAEDVGRFVEGIKDHDWKTSAALKLQSGASLAKEGETYVYTLDEGVCHGQAICHPLSTAASRAGHDLRARSAKRNVSARFGRFPQGGRQAAQLGPGGACPRSQTGRWPV